MYIIQRWSQTDSFVNRRCWFPCTFFISMDHFWVSRCFLTFWPHAATPSHVRMSFPLPSFSDAKTCILNNMRRYKMKHRIVHESWSKYFWLTRYAGSGISTQLTFRPEEIGITWAKSAERRSSSSSSSLPICGLNLPPWSSDIPQWGITLVGNAWHKISYTARKLHLIVQSFQQHERLQELADKMCSEFTEFHSNELYFFLQVVHFSAQLTDIFRLISA